MRALITGVTGQCGSYLAEHLLACGYEVWGMVRNPSTLTVHWLERKFPALRFVVGDLIDAGSLRRAVETARPDEVYNLGALTFVPASWTQPVATTEVNTLGPVRLLEALVSLREDRRHEEWAGQVRLYQASTSEMFGDSGVPVQSETTPFNPCSPYAAAKVHAHQSVRLYRESYGVYAVAGILFNNESPRRGAQFVTRKIARAAAEISVGLRQQLALGNLDAERDWGYSGDYVKAMHQMMRQSEPRDFVIGTGVAHTVAQFAEAAFSVVGLDWQEYVVIDPALKRPVDVPRLCADPAEAVRQLGWRPQVRFAELVERMVLAEVSRAKRSMARGDR